MDKMLKHIQHMALATILLLVTLLLAMLGCCLYSGYVQNSKVYHVDVYGKCGIIACGNIQRYDFINHVSMNGKVYIGLPFVISERTDENHLETNNVK